MPACKRRGQVSAPIARAWLIPFRLLGPTDRSNSSALSVLPGALQTAAATSSSSNQSLLSVRALSCRRARFWSTRHYPASTVVRPEPHAVGQKPSCWRIESPRHPPRSFIPLLRDSGLARFVASVCPSPYQPFLPDFTITHTLLPAQNLLPASFPYPSARFERAFPSTSQVDL